MKLSTYVIDIDDTISKTETDENGNGLYTESQPILTVIWKIRDLKTQGHKIILFTARGMRTFKNDVAKIEAFHRPILEKWLHDWEVPYDELIFGKPWGTDVYYVDDKSLTLNQFVAYNSNQHQDNLQSNKSLLNT